MTTTLFETTRKHVEAAMLDLTGSNDFMPIMALRDHRDQVIVAGLFIPSTGDPDAANEKDVVAWTMSAICALHRAVEVAFTSAAWIVTGTEVPDMPPSQHPDRQEVAMISMLDTDGNASLHTAPVIRENNMVGCGLWEEKQSRGVGGTVEHSGRFFDAIRVGMDMGKQMPPELGEYLDEKIAAGQQDTMIQMMVAMMQKVSNDFTGGGGVQK